MRDTKCRGVSRRLTAIVLAMIMVAGMLCVYSPINVKAATNDITLSGIAHVQTYGNVDGKVVKEDGVDTLVLGTRGQSKRVESITVNMGLSDSLKGKLTLKYRVHRQTYGWTDWMTAGSPAGTTGQGKRLEGIQMKLEGSLADEYDVRYCAHIQTYGDAQGWVYNGALAGTTGEAKRLEEIKVQIVPKNTNAVPSVSYRVHRQTYGWEKTWAKDGVVSGTVGQSKRLEGITIDLKNCPYSGDIVYSTHVQTYGWLNPVKNGEMSGTQGESKRLEAIKINLTGKMADYYDIYYRVHAQSYGWLAWVKNGAESGTSGGGKRLEAIQIVLVKKGSAAPSNTYKGVTSNDSSGYKKIVQPVNTSTVKADAGCVFYDSYAEQVLVLINKERAKYGIAPLTMNYTVVDAAKIRAKEIVVKFDHTRPNGKSCFTALPEAGVTGYRTCGENIAAGYRTPQAVVDGWMDSPGHRANILNPSFKQIGIGCYYNPNTGYGMNWTQMFIG